MTVRAGSFVPGQPFDCLYAMAGDDCSLHFDLGALTVGQKEDHLANQVLTGMLLTALNGIGRPGDYVAMYDVHNQNPWRSLLDRYRAWHRLMGLSGVPENQLSWHPVDTYYASVARNLPDVSRVNLYMVSGSNAVLHQDEPALEISRAVNSKVHFAEHAPAAGLPVPDTLVTTRAGLNGADATRFFSKHQAGVMVKTLGLAGARNVVAVDSLEQAKEYVSEYDDELDVLLQAKLDTSRYTEMTVDITVKPDSLVINNVRRILFADGVWVGNLLGRGVELRDSHRQQLIAVADYARRHGFVSDEGSNCGIDYFVDGDDVIVTEINCRWTGGLFPAEFLRQLDVKMAAVAFIDWVPVADLAALEEFIDEHLHQPDGNQVFSVIPMGFAPFAMPLEGNACVYVWQVITGDFDAFKRARSEKLPETVLPTSARIKLKL